MGTIRAAPVTNQYTILVVDDDRFTREVCADALAGHFVITAEHAEEALEVLREEPVDVILADQTMPGLSGVELLRKALEMRPLAARVLMTSSSKILDAQQAVNRGRISRFVMKPFAPEDLRTLIESAVLDAKQRAENSRLIGELTAKLARAEAREKELTAQIRAQLVRVTELETLAGRDPLTGLYNQTLFHEQLVAEVSRADRYERHLSLVLFDVDHFRKLNELLGREASDALLRELASLLGLKADRPDGRPRRRLSDLPFRIGGDEFALILPETPLAGAEITAARLRAEVERFTFTSATGVVTQVTVSAGVASYPTHARSKSELIVSAERALQAAKAGGRNQVVAAAQVS